jgi:2-oxoglutarate dehydrogenase E2 component (dihydrolipoamide succinyltransferase)
VPINTVVGVIAPEGEAVATPPAPAAAPPAPAPAPPSAAPAPPPAAPPPATPPAPPPSPQAAPRPAPEPVPAPSSTSPQSKQPQADGTPGPPPAPSPAAPAAEKPRAEMSVDELRQTRSSPVVRNIAAEHNVDIREIPGTGISGRVTKQDILTHLETRPGSDAPARPSAPAPASAAPRPAPEPSAAATPPSRPVPQAVPAPPAAAAPAPAPPAPSAPPAAPPRPGGERVQIVPMSPIRKKTAEHMTLSKRTSAHVTTVFEIDLTRVHQLRNKYRQIYEERNGVRLTYMPFIIKATVDALKAYPILNASVEGDAIVYRHDINIGIAVALDWGLIVPVIRNADEKNILGLARAVNDLADRSRTKRLKVDEVQGGTFTITNPGVFGSLFGTPIINQPQVGILAVGTIEKRPLVRDDAIAIRTTAYFALSFDHRVVDGADADRFMGHFKRTLQEFDENAL